MQKMIRKLIGPLAILTFIVTAINAEARLATAGDLPYVIETDSLHYKVEKSGKATVRRTVSIRINNDRGREAQSVQILSFNSRSQKFKLIAAATVNGAGKDLVRTKVSSDNVEIKEIGELSQAFDSIKQVAISYPKVKIGSRLELDYEMASQEVALENYWSTSLAFNSDYVEKFESEIESDLPLYFELNDPKKNLDVKNEIRNGKTIFTIKAVSPIVSVTTQEDYPYFVPERVTSIWISSAKDWNGYARSILPTHKKLLADKLPPIMQEIANEAKPLKTDKEKISFVAAKVAQEFRYFGDWRRRNGGYIPRSLEEIAESRYGDCKDLSLTVTAIYRSLGMKSDMAWIYRGDIPLAKAAYKIPIDTTFNHAVSRVESEGREYWVDATNPVSYVEQPGTDIAGRPAFILDADNARLVATPKLDAKSAGYGSRVRYSLNKNDTLAVDAELEFTGRAAIQLTAKAFYEPIESLNYDIVHGLAGTSKATDPFVGEFAKGSRIVNDVKIPVRYGISDLGLKTTAGLGFPLLRDDTAGRLLTDVKDRAADLYLNTPWRSVNETEIAGVKKIGNHALDCTLKNDYIQLSRSVKDTKTGVKVVDTVEILKEAVPVEYLRSNEFDKFQTRLRSCFNRAAVIVERR
jgi:transglutaminase-like putative cysteine protease